MFDIPVLPVKRSDVSKEPRPETGYERRPDRFGSNSSPKALSTTMSFLLSMAVSLPSCISVCPHLCILDINLLNCWERVMAVKIELMGVRMLMLYTFQ